jgi:ubiquinone/menaquinone biosynthesis C-methylase UbiE
MSFETQHARQKYSVIDAKDYEAARASSKKWASEQAILEEICAGIPKGSTVLDIPCGTGRLAGMFEANGLTGIGMDINADGPMCNLARERGMDVRYGDATSIPLVGKSVDASFCIRLLNWLSEDDTVRALRELQRVTREKITFTIRVAEHPRARSIQLVESALDGWRIAANRHIDDGKPEDTFRMVTLGPVT